jgi:hypothetical protein
VEDMALSFNEMKQLAIALVKATPTAPVAYTYKSDNGAMERTFSYQ